MEGLSEKHCVPCRGGIPPMEKKEAQKYMAKVLGWELIENGKKIKKSFKFKDFNEAMNFVKTVAEIAEAEKHHPDIFISYNKVELVLFTHKINGLHENDFILAAKIGRAGGT